MDRTSSTLAVSLERDPMVETQARSTHIERHAHMFSKFSENQTPCVECCLVVSGSPDLVVYEQVSRMVSRGRDTTTSAC